ncbi:WD40 repeat-like protein [Tilletiaria anomala UBC 951]|uniref:WD40 repeat-like protein n=1 Tax=Tilletiaria anomala (strain ATCC 24038 / CBS 436.72 / UBC 951) TaxID=1037660 RepID=A0A066W1D1_TILAU|nr:WD40 repeat-like protein [Tilletiaria anomala UBC 951]KDN47551.1 WD40 repeat-like protein [Tilletiaria anomala UBC 951]
MAPETAAPPPERPHEPAAATTSRIGDLQQQHQLYRHQPALHTQHSVEADWQQGNASSREDQDCNSQSFNPSSTPETLSLLLPPRPSAPLLRSLFSASSSAAAGIAQPCPAPTVAGKSRQDALSWDESFLQGRGEASRNAGVTVKQMATTAVAACATTQQEQPLSCATGHSHPMVAQLTAATAPIAVGAGAGAAPPSNVQQPSSSSSFQASIQRYSDYFPPTTATAAGNAAAVLPSQPFQSAPGVGAALEPDAGAGIFLAPATATTSAGTTPLVPSPSRKLCVRHQRMADEGTTAKLQKSIESLPLADQRAVNSVWSIFSSSSNARRALILQGILTMCCFSQLSLLSSELALAIRIDPFSLFPREVALKVLSFTDAITLGRAAQVSRAWRELADDDLLWRNMCEQHIERKCEKCGWGLPLLNDKKRRRKIKTSAAAYPPQQQQHQQQQHAQAQSNTAPSTSSLAAAQQSQTTSDSDGTGASASTTTTTSSNGNLKRNITAAANAAALEKRHGAASRPPSPVASSSGTQASKSERAAKRHCTGSARASSGTSSSGSDDPNVATALISPVTTGAQVQPLTRPWKSVYCERLMIERNWRAGRYTVRTLQGHTDGIMCLQFSEALTHPAFPILITGSYDRTARVWNLETGKELRVLKGHTRGVRCLQFDEAKLITGSMDRTLKIWDWRSGQLIRTLEGHTAGIVCLHYNDQILASGSQDSNIKVWNFKTGTCFTLKGHEDWINAVQLWSGPKKAIANSSATSSNGSASEPIADSNANAEDTPPTFLFSASDDCTIRLWDLQHKECLMTYEGHVGQVQSIKLVMLDEDAVLKLSRGAASGPVAGKPDADRRGREARGRGSDGEDGDARGRGPSPLSMQNGDTSAHCGYNPPNVPGGRAPNTNQPDLPELFYSAAAAVASTSARSAAAGTRSAPFAEQHRRPSLDPSASERGIPPQLLKLQDRLSAAGLVPLLPFDAEMSDIDGGLSEFESGASNDARLGRASNAPHIRNQHDQPALAGSKKRSDSKSPARQRTCSRPRPVLLSGSLDNTLKIFDVRTGRCIRSLFGHIEGIWGVDVDKLRIVSASHDRTIKIWDRDSAHCTSTLVGHRAAVTCIALGDDKIVSGSDDAEIKIWSFGQDP